MDKLLLSSLFALLAGFLTAAMSFVKLVNDKESRVSEYRQQWTNTARSTLADLISKIETLCTILEERVYRSMQCEVYHGDKELVGLHEYEKSMLEKTNEARRMLVAEVNVANNLARLHFKLNDPGFMGIETKVDQILDLLSAVESAWKEVDRESRVKELNARIAVLCSEVLALSRVVLKEEWEKVKIGEVIYTKTKQAAKWGGVLFLFVLLTVGVHAFVANHKQSIALTAPQALPINQ